MAIIRPKRTTASLRQNLICIFIQTISSKGFRAKGTIKEAEIIPIPYLRSQEHGNQTSRIFRA